MEKPNGSGLFDGGFDATKRTDPFDFHEDSLSAYDFDRFKLTPHIAKEFIEYDHRNLPLRSSVFSGDQTQAIVVTEYVYNALGQLVGLRKSHQGIHEKTATTGFAYHNGRIALSFETIAEDDTASDQDTPRNVVKILSVNLLGLRGEVLASDRSYAGQVEVEDGHLQTTWSLYHIDGSLLSDSESLELRDFSLGRWQPAVMDSEYANTTRDTSAHQWNGFGRLSNDGGGNAFSFLELIRRHQELSRNIQSQIVLLPYETVKSYVNAQVASYKHQWRTANLLLDGDFEGAWEAQKEFGMGILDGSMFREPIKMYYVLSQFPNTTTLTLNPKGHQRIHERASQSFERMFSPYANSEAFKDGKAFAPLVDDVILTIATLPLGGAGRALSVARPLTMIDDVARIVKMTRTAMKAPKGAGGWTEDAIDAIQVSANRRITPAVEASGLRGWWRNRQVTKAAQRLGYDADKVRYVEEIGPIGSLHPLGGVRNKHTGEILLDRFAFDRAFLRQHDLPGFRSVLAHEIGHQYGIPGRGFTTISPANADEFWASFFGATRTPGLSQREIDALLRHAYSNYR